MKFATQNLAPPSFEGMAVFNPFGYDQERLAAEYARREEDIARALAQTTAMAAMFDAAQSKVVRIDTVRPQPTDYESFADLPLAAGH